MRQASFGFLVMLLAASCEWPGYSDAPGGYESASGVNVQNCTTGYFDAYANTFKGRGYTVWVTEGKPNADDKNQQWDFVGEVDAMPDGEQCDEDKQMVSYTFDEPGDYTIRVVKMKNGGPGQFDPGMHNQDCASGVADDPNCYADRADHTYTQDEDAPIDLILEDNDQQAQ